MRLRLLSLALPLLLAGCDKGSVDPGPGTPTRVDMVLTTVPEVGPAVELGAILLRTSRPVEGVESTVARVLTYDAGGFTHAALVLEQPATEVPFTLVLAPGETTPFLDVTQMTRPDNRLYPVELPYTVEVVRE